MAQSIETITIDQINEFHERGVIVIPNVLTVDEVKEVRKEFHANLKSKGFDTDNPNDTAMSLTSLSSTGGSGGVLDIFYEDWKLKLNEHDRIVSCIMDLWRNTYASCQNPDFSHPYGAFDASRGYMYIDRVCYRLPQAIATQFGIKKKKMLQRSLTPHLDCCPHDMYGTLHSITSDKVRKWKPIQAFIALTDTKGKDEGGFEACPGLHKEFDDWATKRAYDKSSDAKLCIGDFTPIRPKEDADIIDRFENIPCRAGDLVCWDYRIPHANSRYNNTNNAREVVYIGLLPHIHMNKMYAERQLVDYLNDTIPVDQWHESTRKEICSYQFNDLGKKLMTIDEW